MKIRYFKYILAVSGILALGSCKKFFDINKDPDALSSDYKLYPQLISNSAVRIGFEGGSELFRWPALFMQQLSGEASQPNQTYEYYRYNLTPTDVNNAWNNAYNNSLSDLELVIKQATADGSPNYAGIAKILKAYEFSLIIDAWGDVPYTEAFQLSANTSPAYDDDASIYPKLIQLLTEAVADVNNLTNVQTPGVNAIYYANANFATARPFWVKLANTLRLRLLLHYSKKDPAFLTAQMNALIGSGATFFASNADNFACPFYNSANQRNNISAFEVSRPNYLFADARMLALMNTKVDPRRAFYFTDFPVGSGTYVGVSAAAPPVAPNNNYSRDHVFLRGTVTTPAVGTNSAVYSGAASQRILTYTEYCFIRAEATLMYGVSAAPLAAAQDWFAAGITASMTEAGVSGANTTTYLAANGTLTGTNAQKLQQIMEEKYIALFGVPMESWSDYRRTGYPSISVPTNKVSQVTGVPRSLLYPQAEVDLNPNLPG
ncbi:MAG TPA: SusD/RagB family nutrient-binding outer membrane lipoprotein, partial [Chitinophagaceae bacterium]|nr:SusD/RagB family nutrient-binding outer membrane lipoprotein [Chitinophagaceae bacterium]